MVSVRGEWNRWCGRIEWRVVGSVGALMVCLAGCGGTAVEGSEGADGTDGSNGSDGSDGSGGTQGTGIADVPAECVGMYQGNFAGDVRGSLTGTLDAKAGFVVTFVQSSSGQSFSGSGNVAENGKIEVVLGPNRVTGRFNFNRCQATGDWVAGDAQGSWKATHD